MYRISFVPAARLFFSLGMGNPAFGMPGWFAGRLELVPVSEPPAFPPVDITEDHASLVVSARLPGVRIEDIEVFSARDVLIIRCRKGQEPGGREGGPSSERAYESFLSEVRLPEGVDAGKADAVYREGVLRVTLPKIEAGKGFRKIPVKVSKPTAH